jgi:hypothetical protein
VLDIALGTRLPLEQDEKAYQLEPSDESTSDDDDSLGSSISTGSAGSFREAEFRLSSISSRLDSLYKLAARIRSPRNRPQKPMADLCKHIPEAQRADYILNQQQIEASRLGYVQRQYLLEMFDNDQLQELGLSQEELFEQYASTSHWLIARMGMANARRKQQFLYWKKHAQILGRNVEEEPAAPQLHIHASAPSQPGAQKRVEEHPPAQSMATSATKLDQSMMGPSDKKSVISTRSRTSTVVTPQGGTLAWPPAPACALGVKYFPCPYCGILCPDDYLERDNWRAHQIHDLQPYLCTYQDCTDPGRLYGIKQEWIDHENQHRRVWHCHKHEDEFETLPDYLQHLHEKHSETEAEEGTPEMTAAVVGASSEPHRDCPLCPTAFDGVVQMRKHMRYHLERLALYVLPDVEEDAEDQLASESPSDSHHVIENRGRQGSAWKDFEENLEEFLAEFEDDDTAPHEAPRGDNPGLTTASLYQAQSLYQAEPPWGVPCLDIFSARQKDLLDQSENPDDSLPAFSRAKNTFEITLGRGKVAAAEAASKTIPSNLLVFSDDDADTAPNYQLYQVAWICASDSELSAARLIVNDRQQIAGPTVRVTSGDDAIICYLRRVAGHHVVMACFSKDLPYLNLKSSSLLRTFPNIRLGLVVGIGSGAPSPQHDVRLGDIVVDGLSTTSGSRKAPTVFRSAIAKSYVRQSVMANAPGMYIPERLTSEFRAKYARPPVSTDRLYRRGFTHPDPLKSCTEVCHDPAHLVPRAKRVHEEPTIHSGTIDTSFGSIDNAGDRDSMAAELGVISFKPYQLDLEGFPCLVISGICDYADSHKDELWQNYAASIAAMYAKDLLSVLSPETLDDMEPISNPQNASGELSDPESRRCGCNSCDTC